MNSKNFSIKRINNDIKELYQNPIEGIGITSLNNDIKKYIVNIMLLTGPYKNYCLQLLLTFPENYPIKPPKILIYPDQLFDNLYHHHVFNDDNKNENGKCFRKLCIDLLDNDFMSTKEENTGWNPSYTISTLLMQIQIFLSNPDLSENSMPKPYQIKELMESMNNYKRIFYLNDENGEIMKIHTWKDPYPKMFFKLNKIIDMNENLTTSEKSKIIKENLTCFISKMNILDDPNIILGYPIVKKDSNEIYPIPEILSYEGYLTQISNEESYNNSESLKSANNQYYDKWLPIYINKNNFELNKQTILNSFSVIKYGLSGEKNYDFKSEYISEIMIKLLSKMISDIKDKKISISYLRAFFQYILLYKKLSELYPIQINEFFNDDYILRNKIDSTINDLMIFSLFDNLIILEKFLDELKEKMKNNLAYQFFVGKENCDLILPNEFLYYLEENNLFIDIFEIMRFERNLFLYNRKNLKKMVKKIIHTSFKKFILNADEITKDKVKKLILTNMKFYNYIDFDHFYNFNGDINSIDVKEINNNFAIFLYLKKIINENNFINQLENNYGVYLDVDNMLKKLNVILDNISSYYEKEIENVDKLIYDKIINIIKELIVLYNESKKNLSISDIKSEKIKSFILVDDFNRFNGILNFDELFFFSLFGRRAHHQEKIIFYKKFSNSFYKIEYMELHSLKYIYLYLYQRLQKSINPNNKNLSLIESMFIEASLDNNNYYEWVEYISEKEEYYFNNRININSEDIKLNQSQIFELFNRAKELNEKLFSNDINDIEINFRSKTSNEKIDFFTDVILKNIIKFAEDLTGIDYSILNNENNQREIYSYHRIFFDFRHKEYYVDMDDTSKNRLKEIYDTGNIALLTFYEFVWFEEHYNISEGFLSSLKNHIIYNFRLRDDIKQIKDMKKQKIKRINHRNKKNKKNIDVKKYYFKKNKDFNFKYNKIGLWKAKMPIKTKQKKKF